MARKFTLQIIMDLATRIGANPTKLAGTRTNISFLGKGPDKNPLFQNRLAGLENATAENLGDPKKLFGAIEDAVGWMKDGKLNSIQSEILGHNLSGIEKVLHPPALPALPTASVTAIRPGIEGLRRFPKETHKFMGRPLKDKDFSEIDRLVMEGKLPDARGRTWNFKSELPKPGPRDLEAFNVALNQKTGMSRAIARQILQQDTRLKLPEEVLISLRTGGKGADPLDLMKKYYGKSMLNFDEFLNSVSIEGGSPRDLATRVLSEVELIPQFAEGGLAGILQVPTKKAKGGRIGFHRGSLRHQKEHDYQAYEDEGNFMKYLMLSGDRAKMSSPENWINRLVNPNMKVLQARDDFETWQKERFMYGEKKEPLMKSELDKTINSWIKGLFNKKAEGGLAEILQVPRSGYSKGRLVKGALAILNRNKKNADYMFKASDNVSPGYAHGDLKYNAELLADQLAEDAGVLYADLGQLDQIKFYGTAYDYLAKEMGKYRQMTKMLKDVEQKMVLSDFSVKGRKPSASGGLAGILEV